MTKNQIKTLALMITIILYARVFSSISNVRQIEIGQTEFKIQFTSTLAGEALVKYGLQPSAINEIAIGNSSNNNFNVQLQNLNPSTVYYITPGIIIAPGDTFLGNTTPVITASNSSGSIIAYFNGSVDTTFKTIEAAKSLGQLFPDTIKAYLDRAKFSIDFTAYNIDNNNGLIDALNNAVARGVEVRFVGDEAITDARFNLINLPASKKVRRNNADLSISRGLMHNKYVVIDANSSNPDDAFVITGSTNFTNAQLKTDPNNLIIFQDQSMAKAYTMDFEEMLSGKFGPNKTLLIPKEFNLNGIRVEAHFSTSGNVERELISNIAQSTNNIFFGVFSYTRATISNALIERKNQGLTVAGILHSNQNMNDSALIIINNGLQNNLIFDNLPGSWHHKYAIFDVNCNNNARLYTGSANWSSNGNSWSDENVVIVHDENIANQYYQEFISRFLRNNGNPLSNNCFGTSISRRISDNIELNIYPNPTYGRFEIANIPFSNYTVEIYNNQGKKVFTGNNTTEIDLTHKPSGIYHGIVLNSKEAEILQFKIQLQ